jgi:hypothetical protein
MSTLEQFLFLLLPAIIFAGGIGAALLHRFPSLDQHGHRKRRAGAAARHRATGRPVRAHRRSRA